jgi:diguanylate cyclase (GGDEF)-like protein
MGPEAVPGVAGGPSRGGWVVARLTPRPDDAVPLLLTALVVGLACVGGQWIGGAFGPIADASPEIWPPAAVAAALLIVGGPRLWPAVAVGSIVGLLVNVSPAVAVSIALASTVQAAVAGLLVERVAMRPQLDRLVDVGSLALAGSIVPGLLGATIGVGGLYLVGALPAPSIALAWVAWTLGSAVGAFVLGDVAATWLSRPAVPFTRARLPEAVLSLAAVAIVAAILFYDILDLRREGQSVAFPIIPVVLWVAFRVGPRGNALATVIYAAIAVSATGLDRGPFVGVTAADSFLYVAVFTGIVAITGAAVAAVVAERETGRLALLEAGRRATEALAQLQAVERIGRTLAASGPTPEALAAVVDALADVFGYSHPSIYTGDDHRIRLGAQRGYAEPIVEFGSTSPGVFGRVMRTRQIVHLPDVSADPTFVRADPAVTSEVCIPLLSHGTFLGLLNVEDTKELGDRDLTAISVVADRISVSMALAMERASLAEQATRDSLTGLHNRRYFDDAMAQLSARLEREGPDRCPPIGVIMFDLDHFGAVNKDHGLAVGDEALRAFGRILRGRSRTADIVARYGGEEFVAILLDAQGPDAVRLADWVRHELAGTRFTTADGSPLTITVSAGCAAAPHGERTPGELVRAADSALRQAKRAGRNQVVGA